MTKSQKNMNNNIDIKSNFHEYVQVFLEENSKHNLISKNDEVVLYDKHVYDSLGIKLFFEQYDIHNAEILDIGCGGGFPCIPIAIEYPDFKITGIDSIKKKIASVQTISDKLNLKNIELIANRVENISNRQFDIVVSRAVADMSKISSYALPLVKKNGYFIAYKSKKAMDELEKAKPVLEQYNAKVVDIISYQLPLKEVYERNLLCIQKL